ncbi:MAG: protein kinase [Acidobacteriota bacterium]
MEDQISHFKILGEIGSGGMGVVYRARDQRLRRKVALKVLPAGALAEPMIRERLMREAQTASSLNHPHIVTVFEIHSAGDRDFIAMEYVDGESLDRLIGEEGLPLEKALRYGIQIADGLSCAHEHGVIHRDLKPQNVMVSPLDDVKILDFGLAKRFAPPGYEQDGDPSGLNPGLVTLTAPGVKVGTPAYMSPEQIESRPVDARSDVFSFGCLLYEMLTGVPPFHRRNAILIFKAVLSDEPKALRALKPNLPTSLEKLLIRAMAKAPEDRFASMRDVLAELERIQLELFGTGIYPTRSGVIQMPPLRRRPPAWRLPASVAAIVLAFGLIFWLTSRAPKPPTLSGHRPLSTFQSSHRQASFAPSGDRIVYASEREDGSSRLWVQPLGGDLPSELPTLRVVVEQPHWSMAGDRILFAAHGDGVWSLPVGSAGAPERIVHRGSSPQLSPDGERLVFERAGRLWLAAADGTGAEIIESVPPAFFGRWVPRSPAFSPDGRSIVYFQPETGPIGNLWTVDLEGGEPRRLLDRPFRGGDPIWTPDGRWIVFAADLTGNTSLYVVSARGGEAQPLTREGRRHTEPAISPDGRRLVYTSSNPSFTLMLRSAGSGESVELVPPQTHELIRPTLSPAGDRIAFFSLDGADVHLFTVHIATRERLRVTTGAGERNILPQWSADGNHLYFYQERPTRSFRKIPVAGGASLEVLENWSWQHQHDTTVDPAGRRVAYTPLVDGAPRTTRIRELVSGAEHDLGTMLQTPQWSPDGGLLLGSDDKGRIVLCPASGESCRSLVEGLHPRWTQETGMVTFVRDGGPAYGDRSQKLSLWTLDVASRETEHLVEIEAFGPLAFGYGRLPNGDLIWNKLLPGRQGLWIAEVK